MSSGGSSSASPTIPATWSGWPVAIAAARGAGVPVDVVIIGFRPGHPEISARNRTFSALAAAGRFVEGAPAAGSTRPWRPARGTWS